MPGVVLTGSQGFLGWHTRAALKERGHGAARLAVGAAFEPAYARRTIEGSNRLIHVAGINRATESEVQEGNVLFATQLADALRHTQEPPSVISYANSTQAGNGTTYGEAKARAGEILSAAAEDVGARFEDILLPNLFGEHGRPHYNAVTSTFSHMLAGGHEPEVSQDKSLTLLHAQDAADVLAGISPSSQLAGLAVQETVTGLLKRLRHISETYRRGEVPDITDRFDRDLFNTYRSYTFPKHSPIPLDRHADARGSFFETLRSHGGSGQSSFSTTAPGISRGDHFHRRKVERFTVLAGRATIALRKLFTDDVVRFDVTGDEPVSVDMPTMWSHKIVNTGSDMLFTSFWTNEIFDPEAPDTIAEAV